VGSSEDAPGARTLCQLGSHASRIAALIGSWIYLHDSP
jgi:hypothetical protein